MPNNPPIVQTVTSSTVPIRIGMPVNAPYLIMNVSAVSAVWISSDPSVTTGNGTQIPPGSFVTRSVPGELWAILDNASSIAAQIVLDPNAIDWGSNPSAIATAILNSGVILVDNPVLLVSTANTSPFTSVNINASTFNTLIVETSPASVTGTVRIFTIQWMDGGGNVISIDQWKWAVGDTQLVEVSVPIRGSQFNYLISGGGASSQSVLLTGSHRPFTELTNPFANRRLVNQAAALGANASVGPFTIPRYDGPAFLTAQVFTAAQIFVVEVTDLVDGVLVFGGAATVVSTIASYVTSSLILPRNTCTVSLTNGSASATNYRLGIVAAPESV